MEDRVAIIGLARALDSLGEMSSCGVWVSTKEFYEGEVGDRIGGTLVVSDFDHLLECLGVELGCPIQIAAQHRYVPEIDEVDRTPAHVAGRPCHRECLLERVA